MKLTKLRTAAAVVVAGSLAAACAQPLPSAQSPTSTPMPPTLTLDMAVQAALADAARRTGQPVEMLQVQSAAAVTWRDGALGCPQPDFAYTQALVSGYRVRIRAAALELNYHAGPRGPVALCPADRVVEPLSDDARK
jgi:hypothetical protein